MRVPAFLTGLVAAYFFTQTSGRGIDEHRSEVNSHQYGQKEGDIASRSQQSVGVSTQCPSPDEKQEVLKQMVDSQAVKSLRDHSRLFDKPEIQEPVPGVYFMIGWGLSNSIVIDAPDGLIVIDTLDSVKAAKPAMAALRKITQRPVAAIIYTHNHPDHISGTSVFVAGQDRTSYDIWGYNNIVDEFWSKWLHSRPIMLARGFRQVGVPLVPIGGNAIINSGLGPRFVADQSTGLMLNPPNKFLDDDKLAVNVAGLDIELLYIPGETRDQMAILFPDFNGRRMLACGDNYYHMFPNLYAIRGTPPRPVLEWAESVREMRSLKPEVLLPSHTQAIVGADIIYERFTKYMDAIQFVHDQTIRLMNHGLHPDEIVEQVILPQALMEEYTLEHYGRVDWSVKTVFEGQLGWFSGHPEELKPLSPKKKGKAMVDAFGADNILDKSRDAYDDGDYQLALELASFVWHADVSTEETRRLRKDALLKLAENEVSANGRNYFMTWLLEETCLFDNRMVVANDYATLMLVSLDDIFTKLKVMLISDKVDGVLLNVTVVVTDQEPTRSWDLEIRNSILQVSEGDPAVRCMGGTSPGEAGSPMMCMDTDNLRAYLIGQDPVEELNITASGWSQTDVEIFRSYFESAFYI